MSTSRAYLLFVLGIGRGKKDCANNLKNVLAIGSCLIHTDLTVATSVLHADIYKGMLQMVQAKNSQAHIPM